MNASADLVGGALKPQRFGDRADPGVMCAVAVRQLVVRAFGGLAGQVVRSVMNTNSWPGRSGASRTSEGAQSRSGALLVRRVSAATERSTAPGSLSREWTGPDDCGWCEPACVRASARSQAVLRPLRTAGPVDREGPEPGIASVFNGLWLAGGHQRVLAG